MRGMQQSQAEVYRECIIGMMRQKSVTELPFSDVYERLKTIFTHPVTGRPLVRADVLKNSILTESGPLDLAEQGTRIILVDASRLIRDKDE
jgi:hypothetical protein